MDSNGTSEHLKGKNARSTKAVNRPPTVEAVGWRRLDGKASVKDKDLVQKNSSGDPNKADRWWSLRNKFNLIVMDSLSVPPAPAKGFATCCNDDVLPESFLHAGKGRSRHSHFHDTALKRKGDMQWQKYQGPMLPHNFDWGFGKIWLSTARARDTSERMSMKFGTRALSPFKVA